MRDRDNISKSIIAIHENVMPLKFQQLDYVKFLMKSEISSFNVLENC